jgi:membrane associated rhomboid family serine protease
MIPVGDVIPTRTRPIATLASMAAALLAGGPVVQLASNVAALWLFGRTIEDRLGHGRFVVFAAIGALVSTVVRMATTPPLPLAPVAVSGAAAAIAAAYVVLYPRSKVLVLVPVGLPPQIVEAPAFVFLGIWFLLQVIGGLGSPAGFAGTPGQPGGWRGSNLPVPAPGTAAGGVVERSAGALTEPPRAR